jgi:hypothetical protein
VGTLKFTAGFLADDTSHDDDPATSL